MPTRPGQSGNRSAERANNRRRGCKPRPASIILHDVVRRSSRSAHYAIPLSPPIIDDPLESPPRQAIQLILDEAIVYRDAWLVVVNKPSGLLAVPGRGEHLHDSLAVRIQAEFPTARIVHRLDRDTSGLLVMALDADTHRRLSGQFERREVDKRYAAVAHGVFVADSGRIELPLAKDFANPPRHEVNHVVGRHASTEWRVVERGGQRTLLALHPITGRSHQLRVHLAAIGHPILGDNLYALLESRCVAPRLLLHADRLALRHPQTGEPIMWHAAAPFSINAGLMG